MFREILFIATMMVVLMPVMAEATSFSDKNHPEYWGENCGKTEINGEQIYYTTHDDDITKVIIKGGRTHKVYDNGPFVHLTAEMNERSGKPYGISHVIECTDSDTHEPEMCKYNHQLPANHPDCKREKPDRDDCKDKPEQPDQPEEPETPVTPTEPEQPTQPPAVGGSNEVLGSVDQPRELANTGASAGLTMATGLALSGAAVATAVRRKDDADDIFLNTL